MTQSSRLHALTTATCAAKSKLSESDDEALAGGALAGVPKSALAVPKSAGRQWHGNHISKFKTATAGARHERDDLPARACGAGAASPLLSSLTSPAAAAAAARRSSDEADSVRDGDWPPNRRGTAAHRPLRGAGAAGGGAVSDAHVGKAKPSNSAGFVAAAAAGSSGRHEPKLLAESNGGALGT